MAFGWAIIGTGMHPHLKVAPAMALVKGAELVAVYSRSQERAETFAENHDAKAAYDSVDEMLKDSRIDAVFVASPNALHAGHTLRAAEAGKHVLAEKPMATTIEDSLAMVTGCRAAGVKLGIGFELRFNPGHILARKVISQGSIGRISLAQGQWGRGSRGERFHIPRTDLRGWWEETELMGDASVIVGLGVHVIDLFRFILGEEVTEVVAMTDGQTADQPLEHIATMSLRMESGIIAAVSCGRMLPDTLNDFSVYGTDGRITGRATVWEARMGSLHVTSESVNRKQTYPYDYLANFVDELQDFQRAVEEDREPSATGEDGLQVTRVTSAVIESARTGRAVKLEPLTV